MSHHFGVCGGSIFPDAPLVSRATFTKASWLQTFDFGFNVSGTRLSSGFAPTRRQALDYPKGSVRRSVGRQELHFTASDLANGLIDIKGWRVLRYGNGEQVGMVDDIIHIGPPDSDEIYESVLKLVQVFPAETKSGYTTSDLEDADADADEDDEDDDVEYLVPLVDDIVNGVDLSMQCLFITPPAGLLELAKIPIILKSLKPQILEFCQLQNAGVLSCVDQVEISQSVRFSEDAKQVVTWSRHIRPRNRDVFMPTRRQLLAAGRHELVQQIMAAGGFPSVAQALGLPSRRRPVGFWEDPRNLDAEIEWFVSECWIEQHSSKPGEVPCIGSVLDPIPVSQAEEDVGTAVMPRLQQVLAAGRYDLHHAIVMHGGYKAVARELGRQRVPRDSSAQLFARVRNFMEENSLSRLPSISELRASGRRDLANSIRLHGGINALAQEMKLRPKRYGRGQWVSLDVACLEIRSYICNNLNSEQRRVKASSERLKDVLWSRALKTGLIKMPTQGQLLRDGRSDLRYLLQKYGRKVIAGHLGIQCSDKRGRVQFTR